MANMILQMISSLWSSGPVVELSYLLAASATKE